MSNLLGLTRLEADVQLFSYFILKLLVLPYLQSLLSGPGLTYLTFDILHSKLRDQNIEVPNLQ